MPAATTAKSEAEFHQWTEDFAATLSPAEAGATVLGLRGPLGVGKTTFVQKLLAFFGVRRPVTSPTYTIESVYDLPTGPFARAYHLDAYRLEGADDLGPLDFSSRLADPENLLLVEWASIVKEALPENTIFIDICFADDDGREISLSYE